MKNSIAMQRGKYVLLGATCLGVASLFGGFAIAANSTTTEVVELVQNPKPGVRVFSPDYFKPFNPTNAADMVSKIPGFNIQNGDDIRGLADSEGNVLIDGSRPSLKGQDLYSYLSAIPIASVKNIEVLEGAGLGNLGGKHTILVNVIRNDDAKPSGNFTFEIDSWGQIVKPRISGKYNWQSKGFKYAASISSGTFQKERRVGSEYLLDGNGSLIEHGPNNDLQDARGNEASITIDGNIKDIKTNFSFSYDDNKFDSDRNYFAYLPNGSAPIREDSFIEYSSSRTFSLGASAQKTIGKFDTKLNFSAKDRSDDGKYSFGQIFPNTTPSYGLFAPDSKSFEAVAQLSFSRKFPKHAFSFGGETGYNKLDSQSDFYTGDGVNYHKVAGSHTDTIVSEIRSEAFVADNYTISPKLSLDAKLRTEWSTIKQSGDNERERSFTYLKGRLALTYKPYDDLKIKAGIERKLGQLDFNDFAFQASLAEGNNTTSNDHLRPNINDNIDLEIEKTWGENTNFTLSLGTSQIHHAITLIPVVENGIVVGETVGNVDDAKRTYLGVSTKIPLNNIMKGLEFNVDYNTTKSEIIDPFTNLKREYYSNGDQNLQTNLILNLEKQKQEYGIFYFRGERNVDYRMDSQYFWPAINYWGVWAEWKNIKNYEIMLEIDVPNGFTVKRYRTQYEVSRADGMVDTYQYKEREISPRIQFRVRRLI